MAEDNILRLAGDFAAISHDDWLGQVAGVLKGAPFESLRSRTPDGIEVEPLYVREDLGELVDFPGPGSDRRASNPAGSAMGWDVRQQHGLWSTEEALNESILTDLERGVTSVELLGVDNADLAAVLAGVHLDLAPMALCGGGDGTQLARRYLELAATRDVAPTALRADLGCDPVGQLALLGNVGLPIDQALETVGLLAAEVAISHGGVRTIRADGLPFANAGATPATELAALLGCGVAYLRALIGAGLDTRQALAQVLLRVTVGTDQFGDMAKLRALRVLWARVGEASGAPGHRCTVQVATSDACSAAVDPWVNMLRSTVGCFSAAVGGADIVTISPFDVSLGVPDELGLRVARNTQLALMEESNLHRVIDPGGGSYYLEALTDRLAEAAWQEFQQIETQGGVVAALESGDLQRRIAGQADQQAQLVSTRARRVVGVNQFANLTESVPRRADYPSGSPAPVRTDIEPLTRRRLSEGFERLREQADAAAQRPAVFLANLGPAAVHSARSGWVTDVFAAGGIGAVEDGGFDSPDELVAAFSAQRCDIAVLCSSDDIYRDLAAASVEALVGAGAKRVYLAGNPASDRATYEAAGVHEFIYEGCDVLAMLTRTHAALGLTAEGADE